MCFLFLGKCTGNKKKKDQKHHSAEDYGCGETKLHSNKGEQEATLSFINYNFTARIHNNGYFTSGTKTGCGSAEGFKCTKSFVSSAM